ncbi:MAG: hypothetical protein ACYTGB_16985, partial [Planctomycetota bacterium]
MADTGGRQASEALRELRRLIEERDRTGREPEHWRVAAARRRAGERTGFLAKTLDEIEGWERTGVVGSDIADKLREAVKGERAELEKLMVEVARPAAAKTADADEIPVARLISAVSPKRPPEPPEPAESVGKDEPAPAPAAKKPEAVTAEAAAKPAKPAKPAEPAEPAGPAEPAQPWYTVERNLRILANLGILVFNIGLIGFITSAWGQWPEATKVAVLAGYTVLLLAGGLLLRLKTKLVVTGMALLALGVIAIPIDFFAVHYYGLSPVSRGVLGLLGAGTSMVAAMGVGLLTRESLFMWI